MKHQTLTHTLTDNKNAIMHVLNSMFITRLNEGVMQLLLNNGDNDNENNDNDDSYLF